MRAKDWGLYAVCLREHNDVFVKIRLKRDEYEAACLWLESVSELDV